MIEHKVTRCTLFFSEGVAIFPATQDNLCMSGDQHQHQLTEIVVSGAAKILSRLLSTGGVVVRL